MCRHIWLPPGPFRFPVGRVPGYRACRKEHVLPIVRDEFRPVIPRRGARQRCPSPLHRHHQIKAIAASKGIIYHRTVTPLLTGCFSPGDKLSRSLNQRVFAVPFLLQSRTGIVQLPLEPGNHLQPPPPVGVHGGFGGGSARTGTMVGSTPVAPWMSAAACFSRFGMLPAGVGR